MHSIARNVAIDQYGPAVGRNFFRLVEWRQGAARRPTSRRPTVDPRAVAAPGSRQLTAGNQQKVSIAKCLGRQCRELIIDRDRGRSTSTPRPTFMTN